MNFLSNWNDSLKRTGVAFSVTGPLRDLRHEPQTLIVTPSGKDGSAKGDEQCVLGPMGTYENSSSNLRK